jgi:5-methylcytosine-specific restriction endonuclease McrA
VQFSKTTLKELAVMICGDFVPEESFFISRGSGDITDFFRDIKTDYVHDGSARQNWVAGTLNMILAEPQASDDAPPETFARVIRRLMRQKDALNEAAERPGAIALLNSTLKREGFEAFYTGRKQCHLRRTGDVRAPSTGDVMMPRSRCPWCNRQASMRSDGRFYPHNDLSHRDSRVVGAVRCSGTGQTAAEYDPAISVRRKMPVRPWATVPRDWLWRRDGGLCWICGAQTTRRDQWNADHVIPRTASEEAVQAAGLERHPGDSWTNLAVSCFDCNMDKGARWGDREVAKHRELAALYPDGFCISLRLASEIGDHEHVPMIYVEWDSCLRCKRMTPNLTNCPDCAKRKGHIRVYLSHMKKRRKSRRIT